MKKAIDRAFMVLWVLLGLGVCVNARALGVLGRSGPDSGFFPMVTGVLILGSGVALLLTRDPDTAGNERFFELGRDSAIRVLLVSGALLGMIVLIPHIGFLLTGILVVPLLLRAIDERSWAFCIGVGALGATAIVLLFSRVLNVPLPVSALGI
jgi:hypothetical protein